MLLGTLHGKRINRGLGSFDDLSLAITSPVQCANRTNPRAAAQWTATIENYALPALAKIMQLNEAIGSSLVVGSDSFGRAGFVPAPQERLRSDFVSVPQGWQLLLAYATADQLAADGRLYPVKTPLLTANIENLIVEDGPNGRFFAKRDAGQSGVGQLKIYGAMALLGALELISEHRKPIFDVGALVGSECFQKLSGMHLHMRPEATVGCRGKSSLRMVAKPASHQHRRKMKARMLGSGPIKRPEAAVRYKVLERPSCGLNSHLLHAKSQDQAVELRAKLRE